MEDTLNIIPSCESCPNDSTIFCSLTCKEKEEFSKDKSTYFFKKGDVIFHEGNQSHGLFCIYEGKKMGKNK